MEDEAVGPQQWEHRGLKCVVRRSLSIGVWCGYVAVPEGHPAFGLDIWDSTFDVHGGVTFSNDSLPYEAKDGLWWIGFDTGHAGDILPKVGRPQTPGATYKDVAYVIQETNRLADQLADLSGQ